MVGGVTLGSLAQQEQRDGQNSINEARLIGNRIGDPIEAMLEAATVTAPAAAGAPLRSLGMIHRVGPPEHAVIAAPDTGAPAASGGGFSDMRIISEPVEVSILQGAIVTPTGPAAPAEGVIGQSVLHRLVTAMAGFGGDHASPLTSAIAQHEVDAARATLAAHLHFIA